MKGLKKILSTVAAMGMVITLVGQPTQAAPEKPVPGVTIAENTDYPETDANYQVTFTYKASSEDVESVDLVGNFTFYTEEQAKEIMAGKDSAAHTPYEYKDGMFQTGYGVSELGYVPLEMTDLGDGYFQITLPLPGCQYCYGFIEDDEMKTVYKDPTNLPIANGDSNSGWSLIYVGNENDCLVGQEYIYPRTDGKTGTLEFVNYTAVDGSTQPLGVYLPYGYDSNKAYKTLYISHGGGGNEVEWFYIGSAKNIFDNLVAEGEVEPTVVVTMDNSYFEWDMEPTNKNLVDYIIPFVESHFSVATGKENRAMAGLSNGGYTTVNEMIHAQDVFGYYGIFSPNYRSVNVLDEATEEQLKALAGSIYYECSGTVDNGMGRQDRYGTVNTVYETLVKNGADATLEWKNGAHDWGIWRASLTTFAKDYLWTKVEETPTPGVVVEENTLFTETTPDAHYQATFTLDTSSFEKEVAKVEVGGNMQFYTEDQLPDYLKNENEENSSTMSYSEFVLPGYTAYEYESNMFTTGIALDLALTGQANYLYELKPTTGNPDLYTVSIPLPGGQYYYDYFITYADGTTATIKDPANLPVANGDSDSGHSLFYVGNRNDCIAGEEFVFPRDDEKIGTVEFVDYTASDGSTQSLGVYLPYGYDENHTYKTLYLSHGGGGNEVEWFYIGSAKNIFDNLIAEEYMEPTVIVTMDNQKAPFSFEKGESLKNILENVIPYVEENYSVSTQRSGRAMAGLSSGATVTCQALLQANDVFDYYGVFSPSRTLDFAANTLTDEMRADMKDAAKYYISCGIYDAYLRRNADVKVYEELVASGADASYEWKNGTHDWAVWRAQLTTFAKDYLWTEKKVTPENPDTPNTPDHSTGINTGDNANVMPIVLTGMMALAVGAVVVYKKKKETVE